ncbi:15950_t:CDS:2 [Funneliformis geosporum]|nr:15950_t:CDS:2 [Funneliformis geosporum]
MGIQMFQRKAERLNQSTKPSLKDTTRNASPFKAKTFFTNHALRQKQFKKLCEVRTRSNRQKLKEVILINPNNRPLPPA